MKVNIQVQCTTKPLDQRYRARAGCLFRIACLLDQMGGDDAIDYPEHLARDHRTAGVNWRTVFELQRSPEHEFDWQSTLY